MLTYTLRKVFEKFLKRENFEMVSTCYDWMYNASHLGLEGLGRLILIVSYGAWGISSYLMDAVLSK